MPWNAALSPGDVARVQVGWLPLKAGLEPGRDDALAGGVAGPRRGDDVAIPLCLGSEGQAAVLLCRLEDDRQQAPTDGSWDAFIEMAEARLAAEIETAQLRDALARLEQTEKLQRALFAIADMAGSDLDMPEMLRGLHRIVSGLMYAENFFIALYDPQREAIRFLYYADVADDTGISGPLPTGDQIAAELERFLRNQAE